MCLKTFDKSEPRRRIAVIGNQAFSLLNFRGLLIAEMVKRRHEVFALAPDYDEETRAAVRNLGAEPVDFSLSRTGMNPVRDAADTLRLAFLLRRLKPYTTLAYVPKLVIYGILAAWLARVPRRFALITGLGYAFTPSSSSESLKRQLLREIVLQLYRAALRHADKVIFQNDDDRAVLINAKAIDDSKSVRVCGTGVDLNQWQPASPVLKPVTFLLAARLLREKGIVEYARAAKLIKQKYPETRFILLGRLDTNPGALSHNQVEAWVASGLLEWPGQVPDVRPWLAKTSVYVLPSYREGVPRSTQEAMAMARPVITTDAPGCRDTVIEDKNGFLVPVLDANALAAAMERFIIQPDLIDKMGQASRNIAEERFDARKINQTILHEMGIL
jgi:glycosyltransferase involved in cell wall biosynthesis